MTENTVTETATQEAVGAKDITKRTDVISDADVAKFDSWQSPLRDAVKSMLSIYLPQARQAAQTMADATAKAKTAESELDTSDNEAAVTYRETKDAETELKAQRKSDYDAQIERLKVALDNKYGEAEKSAREATTTSRSAARKAIFGEVAEDAGVAKAQATYASAIGTLKAALSLAADDEEFPLTVDIVTGAKVNKSGSGSTPGEGPRRYRLSYLAVDGSQLSDESGGKITQTLGLASKLLKVQTGTLSAALFNQSGHDSASLPAEDDTTFTVGEHEITVRGVASESAVEAE